MDITAINVIASSIVSLLVPYFKMLADNLLAKSSEKIGEVATQTAINKASQLYEVIKKKFAKRRGASSVLKKLRETPSDSDLQAVVRFHIKEIMASDEKFTKELAHYLKDISETGADNIFHTTILGNVEKLTQIGNIFGDVEIN